MQIIHSDFMNTLNFKGKHLNPKSKYIPGNSNHDVASESKHSDSTISMYFQNRVQYGIVCLHGTYDKLRATQSTCLIVFATLIGHINLRHNSFPAIPWGSPAPTCLLLASCRTALVLGLSTVRDRSSIEAHSFICVPILPLCPYTTIPGHNDSSSTALIVFQASKLVSVLINCSHCVPEHLCASQVNLFPSLSPILTGHC